MDMTEETTPKPDAFEAALAANAEEISSPTPEVLETPVVEVAVDDLALASDEDGDIESDENDPNAEFRRTLRAAIGDWFVVHSYAGYEKKVKGNLANRIQSLNMEDYIFQIEVPEEEVMEIKNGARKMVSAISTQVTFSFAWTSLMNLGLLFVILQESQALLEMHTTQVHSAWMK